MAIETNQKMRTDKKTLRGGLAMLAMAQLATPAYADPAGANVPTVPAPAGRACALPAGAVLPPDAPATQTDIRRLELKIDQVAAAQRACCNPCQVRHYRPAKPKPPAPPPPPTEPVVAPAPAPAVTTSTVIISMSSYELGTTAFYPLAGYNRGSSVPAVASPAAVAVVAPQTPAFIFGDINISVRGPNINTVAVASPTTIVKNFTAPTTIADPITITPFRQVIFAGNGSGIGNTFQFNTTTGASRPIASGSHQMVPAARR